jgi:hypothetical protein
LWTFLFSRYSGFFINKTDRHNITEILLKVTLSTITLTLYVKIYFQPPLKTEGPKNFRLIKQYNIYTLTKF